jgi:predicted phage terminase large subunit-like protein
MLCAQGAAEGRPETAERLARPFLMRLHAQTAELENGRVLLPRLAPWLDEYVRELTSFPGSKYDDQVDSTTQALDHLKSHRLQEIWARL